MAEKACVEVTVYYGPQNATRKNTARLRPPKCDKKEDPQVWATSFPHLLTLTQKEKKLNPKAMITYKRPTTIGQKLTNCKDLALNKTRKQTNGGSRPCEHCALCGCYGKNNKSMVPNVSQLLTKTKLLS